MLPLQQTGKLHDIVPATGSAAQENVSSDGDGDGELTEEVPAPGLLRSQTECPRRGGHQYAVVVHTSLPHCRLI
jgi:hypothetical protein